MAAATQASLVLWAWKTDQGNWHAYPPALCENLEDAWKGKVTRFPVDAERFVDTVKMVQRRLDMTGKAREVKRELQPALKHHVFAIIGSLASATAVNQISEHCGLATLYITEKVTVALCDQPDKNANALAEAKSLKIPVVSSLAVQELISKREKANIDAFALDLKDLTVLDDCTGLWKGQKAVPVAKAVNVGTKMVVDKPIALPKPVGLPWRNGYVRALDASTEWMGALLSADSAPLPVCLAITFFGPSGEWTGLLTSPTSGSRVQVSGLLIPGGGPPMENGEASHTVHMTTNNLISGKDAKLANLSLHGGHVDAMAKTITFADSLSLSYVRHVPVAPLAFIQPGTTWKGTSSTNIARFELSVEANDGFKMNGSIHWPEFAATNTFKGTFENDGEVQIEESPEDAALEDVEMQPTVYSLRAIPQLISDAKTTAFMGTWSTESDGTTTTGATILTPVP